MKVTTIVSKHFVKSLATNRTSFHAFQPFQQLFVGKLIFNVRFVKHVPFALNV